MKDKTFYGSTKTAFLIFVIITIILSIFRSINQDVDMIVTDKIYKSIDSVITPILVFDVPEYDTELQVPVSEVIFRNIQIDDSYTINLKLNEIIFGITGSKIFNFIFAIIAFITGILLGVFLFVWFCESLDAKNE